MLYAGVDRSLAVRGWWAVARLYAGMGRSLALCKSEQELGCFQEQSCIISGHELGCRQEWAGARLYIGVGRSCRSGQGTGQELSCMHV
jgi:hypothetical protein